MKVTVGGSAARVVGMVAAKGVLVSAEVSGGQTQLSGWNPSTGKRLWSIKAPGPLLDLRSSADGESLLATTRWGTNVVYRLTGGAPKLYRKWKRKKGRKKGRTQGLTADGKMLVRGDVRGQVRGYTLDKYKMKWLARAEQVVLSADGKVAACVKATQVQLRDAVDGRAVGKPWSVPGTLLSLAGRSRSSWAWVYDCGTSGCGIRPTRGAPAPVCKLQTSSGLSAKTVCHPSDGLGWSPDGTLLVLFGVNRAELYRITSKTIRRVYAYRARGPQRRLLVAFPAGGRLAVANHGVGEIHVYGLRRR